MLRLFALFWLAPFAASYAHTVESKHPGFVVSLERALETEHSTYTFEMFLKGERRIFLLDSGVEVPSISKTAVDGFGYEILTVPNNNRAAINGLTLDLTRGKSGAPFGFRGPVFVANRAYYRQRKIDGLFPINMISYGLCQITDLKNARITLSEKNYCRQYLETTDHVIIELKNKASTDLFPYWVTLASLELNDKKLSFLVDTGTARSFVHPNFIEVSDLSVEIVLFKGTNNKILGGKGLKNICISLNDQSVYLPAMAALAKPTSFNLPGVLGVDFLEMGELITIDKQESFFIFNKAPQIGNCSPSQAK